MKRSAFVLILLGAALLAETVLSGPSIKTLVFPTETSSSYAEMIPAAPLSLSAFTLCLRVATELSGEREVILFAYRTRDFDELNVWRELDGSLSFALSGGTVIFKIPALQALETHLCFTWNSRTGITALFVDGKKSLAKIYKKGHSIHSGGRVILGQDPDNFLGGFESTQSFVGEIGDVNLWDYVLSDHQIKAAFNRKPEFPGNVVDWETVELRITGDVHVVHREL